ncbi:hypothetical protein J4441_05530 [Candidatus Micrarchaeota archaeon]|nr:hypothetical protein [Candidatus Micrarchaeota archaeon]
MDAQLYATLNKGWKSTCRVLFGKEIGELEKYEEWLGEYLPPVAKRRSHLSGKKVIVAKDSYPKNARFISEDELTTNRSYTLSINDIKDVDSIMRALCEKCEYTGNRFLGNSAHMSESDIVLDSQYVHNSTNIEQSTYIYSSYMMRRGSKYSYGSGWTAAGEFTVRCVAGINLRRCLESHAVADCSDTYFSFDCHGCTDILFSFGQRSKNHMIGNLPLAKEKYAQIKAKLLGEIAAELESKKCFPPLFALVPKMPPKNLPKITPSLPKDEKSMAAIEKGFSSTYGVILKSKPFSICDYEEWLEKNTVRVVPVQSAFGNTTYLPQNFPVFSLLPKHRLISVFESIEAGKSLHVREQSLSSLPSLLKELGNIAFFTAEFYNGENRNIISAPHVLHSANVYKGYEATYSEHSGCTSLSLHSKYVYGCHRIIDSQFSLKCYNSLYLNRCLELDGCTKCADSYFCHNCEGMSDSMFCFNAKGKRFSIGNTDLQREKYAQVKEMLLSQMAGELDKNKSLKWDIYNIGAKNS